MTVLWVREIPCHLYQQIRIIIFEQYVQIRGLNSILKTCIESFLQYKTCARDVQVSMGDVNGLVIIEEKIEQTE